MMSQNFVILIKYLVITADVS